MEPNEKETVLGLDNLIKNAKLQFVRGKHKSLPFEFISEEERQARQGIRVGSQRPSRQPSDPIPESVIQESIRLERQRPSRQPSDPIPESVIQDSIRLERHRHNRMEEVNDPEFLKALELSRRGKKASSDAPIPEVVLRESIEDERQRAQRSIQTASEEEQLEFVMRLSKASSPGKSSSILYSGHSKIKNVVTHDNGNYRLKVLHTPPDGNCMYHAIANTLKKIVRDGHTRREFNLNLSQNNIITKLRLIAVNQLLDNITTNGLNVTYEAAKAEEAIPMSVLTKHSRSEALEILALLIGKADSRTWGLPMRGIGPSNKTYTPGSNNEFWGGTYILALLINSPEFIGLLGRVRFTIIDETRGDALVDIPPGDEGLEPNIHIFLNFTGTHYEEVEIIQRT
jgi:hypothetical protein